VSCAFSHGAFLHARFHRVQKREVSLAHWFDHLLSNDGVSLLLNPGNGYLADRRNPKNC